MDNGMDDWMDEEESEEEIRTSKKCTYPRLCLFSL
jgi:hypothetical protein